MRIVCDNCSAKYSIADEKIAGKLFKVRCKKCNTMIMVDGRTVPDTEQASAGGDPTWYVVIDGEQQGPMSEGEVHGQLSSGAIDWGTFAWREGMGDWLPLSDIQEFAEADSDGGGDPFEDEATRVVGTDEASNLMNPEPQRLDSGLVEPVAGLSGSGLLAGGGAAASHGADFFASARAAAEQPKPAAAAAPTPASAAASGPTAPSAEDAADGGPGERNESSVLFSLSDLTSKKKKKEEADIPRTEGSGLIDIRVLASAAATKPDDKAPSNTGGGGALAAAPMVALPPRRSNKGLTVMIGLGVLLIVGLGVALALLLTQKPAEQEPMAQGTTAQGTEQAANVPAEAPTPEGSAMAAATPPTAVPVETPPPAGSGATADGSGAVAAADGSGAPSDAAQAATGEAEALAAANAGANDEEEEEEEATRRDDDDEEEEERAAPREEREERVAAATPPSGGEADERSPEAVNRALEALRRNNNDSEPEPEPEAAPEPRELSQDDVRRTVRRYGSRIGRCRTPESEGQRYRVSWVIQPSGSVTNVRSEASDDASRCIMGVVRDMSFPSFDGEAVPIRYPFSL